MNRNRIVDLIKLALVINAVLIFVMAAISNPNSPHPDEAMHIQAVDYFLLNWLPPDIQAGYFEKYLNKTWGISYLVEWGVNYAIVGKLVYGLNWIFGSSYLNYRIFGVFVYVVLALYVLKKSGDFINWGVFIPLLITPQVWYVFSYVNGDFFPFAVSYLLVFLSLQYSEKFRVALFENKEKIAGEVILYFLLFGFLILSKKNYWPVGVFSIFLLLYRSARVPQSVLTPLVMVFAFLMLDGAFKGSLKSSAIFQSILLLMTMFFCFNCWKSRMVIKSIVLEINYKNLFKVVALVLLVSGPYICVDVVRNGFGDSKENRVSAVRELNAEYKFRPSTLVNNPGESYVGLGLRDKGVGIVQLVDAPYYWGVATFRSFFGGYGFMQFFSTEKYYSTIKILIALLLIAAVISAVKASLFYELFLSIAFVTALLLASIGNSWVYDFQAQGRYLFGFLPMMMPLFCFKLKDLTSQLALGLVFVIWAMGVYSFVFIGLINLR